MTNSTNGVPDLEIPVAKLTWHCDPASFDFETTAEIPPVEDIIGQERAVRAITLGLEMKSPGFNIFLSGFVGTGRATTIQHFLKRLDPRTKPPDDLVYVHDFVDPDSPRALFLPAGDGRAFAQSMATIGSKLRRELPKTIDAESHRARRGNLLDRIRARQRDLLRAFEKKAVAEGFTLIQVQAGELTHPDLAPIVEGQARPFAELEERVAAGTMSAADLARLTEKSKKLSAELDKVTRAVARLETELSAALAEENARAVRPLVSSIVAEARERFVDDLPIQEYLDRVEVAVLANLNRYWGEEGGELGGAFTAEGERASNGARNGLGANPAIDPEFQVNLLVDNQETRGAPVIVENAPTLARLFGMVERTWSPNGEGPPDHRRIKAGSLHRAHGGYLVLNATDVFAEPPQLWNTLKRTLRTGMLEIPDPESGMGLGPPALKPEPVCISVKVILIGDLPTYSMLWDNDDDFQKTFKIRADFDTEMENTPANVRLYGAFVERLRRDEKTATFDRSGLARLAESGARLAGRQDKLSTRFHVVADVAREASHWAAKDGQATIAARHVAQALEERDSRGRLGHEKLLEMIRDGLLFIDVEGLKIGQVNGLSVYDVGEQVFGAPVKITATVGMGTAGIINIEREAELSGRSHDKGMQILAGYLRAKYAQDKPLTLTASVCFEQSYTGIDGDSASSTELYAILSALGSIPIRQELAVTGSVNQNGEIQPIGDVNEKVEGFFDVCSLRGLTGTQGVLVPRANVTDLMLHPRVLEAAHAGKFHLYAVSTIDDGFSILASHSAGELTGRRRFPRESLNGKIDHRLRELAATMRDFGGHP